MSHLNFWILAFSTNSCPIKTDLSGNTVWPEASGFQKLTKMDHFWHFLWTFVHSKCKRSSLRSQSCMRLFLWFSAWFFTHCAILTIYPPEKWSCFVGIVTHVSICGVAWLLSTLNLTAQVAFEMTLLLLYCLFGVCLETLVCSVACRLYSLE